MPQATTLVACALVMLAGSLVQARAEAHLVKEGPLPDITVDGAEEIFILRDGVTLPDRQKFTWGRKDFTFRWREGGGALPYPPYPGTSDSTPIYPNIALVGGTSDPRAAFIVQQVICRGGYDPHMSYSISIPARYPATGEWVFDVDASQCDGI